MKSITINIIFLTILFFFIREKYVKYLLPKFYENNQNFIERAEWCLNYGECSFNGDDNLKIIPIVGILFIVLALFPKIENCNFLLLSYMIFLVYIEYIVVKIIYRLKIKKILKDFKNFDNNKII